MLSRKRGSGGKAVENPGHFPREKWPGFSGPPSPSDFLVPFASLQKELAPQGETPPVGCNEYRDGKAATDAKTIYHSFTTPKHALKDKIHSREVSYVHTAL